MHLDKKRSQALLIYFLLGATEAATCLGWVVFRLPVNSKTSLVVTCFLLSVSVIFLTSGFWLTRSSPGKKILESFERHSGAYWLILVLSLLSGMLCLAVMIFRNQLPLSMAPRVRLLLPVILWFGLVSFQTAPVLIWLNPQRCRTAWDGFKRLLVYGFAGDISSVSAAAPKSPVNRLVLVILAVTGVVILFLHIRYYYPFLADDALISLRYAQRLLEGHGLTWTGGRPVEGYSNLLWVLLNAFLGLLRLDLVLSARLLGSAGILTGIAALFLTYKDAGWSGMKALTAGMVVIVLSGSAAIWAIGGLEQPLVFGLLGLALAQILTNEQTLPARANKAWGAGLCLGLICLARVDGFILTLAFLFAVVAAWGINRRTFQVNLRILSLPALFYASQTAFRLFYYGEWVPNTALVKVHFTWLALVNGLRYVANCFLGLAPFSFLALILAVFLLIQRKTRTRAILIVIPWAAWSAYIILVGGDFFPAFRLYLPVLICIAFLVADGILYFSQVPTSKTASRWLQPALLGAFLILSAWYGAIQFLKVENQYARKERWEWNGKAIGLVLKQAFGSQQPTIAVDAAGSIPYWSELPAIDMLGLNDYYLPRHPPKDIGMGQLGHELGDGKYIFNLAPDLIQFSIPLVRTQAVYRSGLEMQEMPEFTYRYTPVVFEGQDPILSRATIWVLKSSPKIGIRQDDHMVTVPAYLLNGNEATVAHLDEDGRLVVSSLPEQPAILPSFLLPGARWQFDLESSGKALIRIQAHDSGQLLIEGEAPLFYENPLEQNVDISVLPTGASPIQLHTLYLKRSD